MKELHVTSDITFIPAEKGSRYYAYDGWCWTVYLNGAQYASEILPEKSKRVALRAIRKWTRRALKETNPFYFPEPPNAPRKRAATARQTRIGPE